MSTNDDDWQFYRYNPSIAVASISSVAFFLITSVHCWLLYRTRAWFLIPLVLGGVFELAGFAARAYNASETPDWTLVPYIIQSVLPLLGPTLYAASIYMILGRIILMTNAEHHSLIRRKWLTKIFVIGDVLSFQVQGGGAGAMSSGGVDSMHTGELIVITGLALQILIFGIFVVVAYIFHTRMLKAPTQRVATMTIPWLKHLHALYGSSALILVRSLFRVIEYAQGNNGYLFRHEAFMYLFDTILMFAVMVLFWWIHPGEIRGILEKLGDSEGSIPLIDNSNPVSTTKRSFVRKLGW